MGLDGLDEIWTIVDGIWTVLTILVVILTILSPVLTILTMIVLVCGGNVQVDLGLVLGIAQGWWEWVGLGLWWGKGCGCE